VNAQAGRLVVVGLGPGAAQWITPEATQALAAASDLVGYGPYLARLPERPGQLRHASDNREEVARAREALELAASGRRVAVVSGGDPGVFAMAAAVFEAIEEGDALWRDLDVTVIPGVTAMQAAAARIGAPLGHDFCAISLSDNLKPWAVVEKRLIAAIEADFVVALYNPASKARPDRIREAFTCLRARKSGTTPVIFARAVGRDDERIGITTLSLADPGLADMATLVIIGSSETRMISRSGAARPFVYTPRGYGARP
jgi:precorrin-3B C17-methyltransferase